MNVRGQCAVHAAITHLFLAILLAGCGTTYRTETIINTSKPYAEIWTKRRVTINYCDHNFYINPYTYNPAAKRKKDGKSIHDPSDSLFVLATSSSSESAARDARNRIQDAIISVSTDETQQHLANLKATENNINTLFGAAAIGLSGGATVAAATTARALSAAATGAGGFRALYNEQTYRNALVDSLIRAIETDRADFLANVIRPRQTNSVHDYTVESAIMDAKEFHKRGSFYYGLTLIRQDVERANASRTQSVSNATRIGNASMR
jgi:hypothetical protein